MKKTAILLSAFLVLTFISCEKNSVSPAQPATQNTVSVSVEYKIHANSGNFSFEYLVVDAQNQVTTVTGTSNKATQSFYLSVAKNKLLSVKAKNTNPSNSEVSVEIYVNGTLKASGLANAAGKYAEAQTKSE